jgi:phosphopantetheine--protein transferase-like protein
MRNFSDDCYGIVKHNDITRKFPDFSLSFFDILKTQDRLNRKGETVYNRLFSEWENSYVSGIAVSKRRTDFICGRLASKKAVRKQLLKDNYCSSEHDGCLPGYKDIEIRRTVTGKPALFIKDGKSRNGSSDYHISISHTQEVAAAFTTRKHDCKDIGIDIEKIEERHSSFLDVAFTENEIRKLNDILKRKGNNEDQDKYQEEIARFWTIKESVMKCMGVGVNIDLKDIEVSDSQLHTAQVNLKNDAIKRFKLLKGNEIKVQHVRIEGFVVSLAWLF